MANLYDTSATKALNEDEYINKLYDSTLDSQKKVLQQGFEGTTQQLNAGQQNTQQQTSDYVKRAYVEGQRSAGTVQRAATGGVGSNTQAQLTLGNQNQANNSALRNQQAAADQEYERQRKLLADRYSAQIKQAQADNDMVRAQALVEAARAEEEQLRAMRQNAATMMAGEGDMSIAEAIAQGAAIQRDTTSPTWENVLKNEEGINKIYDAQLESARLQAQMAHDESMSNLEAQQRAAQRQTDQALNDTYVDALKRNKNYLETQTAHGQSSGTAMQERLARETELTGRLTDLRKLQMGKDAETELEKTGAVRGLGEAIAKAKSEGDRIRNQALYDAAEREEQALIEEQQTIGKLLAKNNNYSVLGALYGLTPEQIRRLQGEVGGYGDGGQGKQYYTGWENQLLQAMANSGIAAYEARNPNLSANRISPIVIRGNTSGQKWIM
jgi:hypothetical protein